MYGRFDGKKDVANLSRGKTSVMRNIKRQITAQYPMIKDKIAELIPKKGDVTIAKWCVSGLVSAFDLYVDLPQQTQN